MALLGLPVVPDDPRLRPALPGPPRGRHRRLPPARGAPRPRRRLQLRRRRRAGAWRGARACSASRSRRCCRPGAPAWRPPRSAAPASACRPSCCGQLRFGRGLDNRRLKATGYRLPRTTRETVLDLREQQRLARCSAGDQARLPLRARGRGVPALQPERAARGASAAARGRSPARGPRRRSPTAPRRAARRADGFDALPASEILALLPSLPADDLAALARARARPRGPGRERPEGHRAAAGAPGPSPRAAGRLAGHLPVAGVPTLAPPRSARKLRLMRSRSILLVVVLVLVLLGSLAGVVYAYDQADRDQIAKGVTVGGVDVGGLTGAEARARLAARAPRRRSSGRSSSEHGRQRWRLRAARGADRRQPRRHGRAGDGAQSRDGNIVQRAWRGLTGDRRSARDLEPEVTYSDRGRHAARWTGCAAGVDRPAKDATVEDLRRGRAGGRRADRAGRAHPRAAPPQIRAAITDPRAGRRVQRSARRRRSRRSPRADLAEQYATVVVVNRGAFKLTLYKGLKAVKTYRSPSARSACETPAGLYPIQNKAVNPAWHVPNSAWAGDLRRQGHLRRRPDQPAQGPLAGHLRRRGHPRRPATTARSAAPPRTAASACAIPDVEDLYDRVPVGAPVYIA